MNGSSNHAVAIVGGTLGGVLLLVILLSASLFLRRRRLNHQQGDKHASGHLTKEHNGPHEAPTNPVNNELDASQAQELEATGNRYEMR